MTAHDILHAMGLCPHQVSPALILSTAVTVGGLIRVSWQALRSKSPEAANDHRAK